MSVAQTMDKLVTLQQRAAGKDAYGQPVLGWQNLAEVWASVKDVSGRQYVAAGATQNSVQTTITIRDRAGVMPAMRVVHGANVYDIESVLGPDRGLLQLMVKRHA